MNDKSSENRAPWPLYSQSFYYSLALDNNDIPTYHFVFILVSSDKTVLLLYKKKPFFAVDLPLGSQRELASTCDYSPLVLE